MGGAASPMQSESAVLEGRLENWGGTWRSRYAVVFDPDAKGFAGAVESHQADWYRSPQPWDAPLSSARGDLDLNDALVIEHAVCALDGFHHALLKCWYVRRWHPAKCLRVAARTAAQIRTGVGAFDAALGMSKALLADELTRPAVLRRQRVVDRVRKALGTGVVVIDTRTGD